VSTLSWLAFLPFAMLFALVSHRYGISATGWIVTGLTALFGLTLLRLSGPVAVGRRGDAPSCGGGDRLAGGNRTIRRESIVEGQRTPSRRTS
jgi:hypothetical protein